MLKLQLRCWCLLLDLLAHHARAQPAAPPRYRNLVMEGGGIRGIAYGGALLELEQRGVLAGLTRVGGTSAGAIQAALLAVGYSAQESIEVVNATPVQRLNDGRGIFFGGTHRLVKEYGWYRGDEFSTYLGELVARKTQNAHLTLGELHSLALKEPTHFRDQVAMRDRFILRLKIRKLIETTTQDLFTIVDAGNRSTTFNLRRLHRPATQVCPSIRVRPTRQEQGQISADDPCDERRNFHEVLWHTGASQGDAARLTAEMIDWANMTLNYRRAKLAEDSSPAPISIGPKLEEVLRRLPPKGRSSPTSRQ